MPNNSRDTILNKLKKQSGPFPDSARLETYLEMVPLTKTNPDQLWQQFARESEKLSARVYICDSYNSAEKKLHEIIGDEKNIFSWTEENLPAISLPPAIQRLTDVNVREYSEVKMGITGAVAALASTASIIINSGKGRFRVSSLLPEIHIVLIEKNRIYPTFENWLARQRKKGMQDLLHPANLVLISGPSRTADIAMELILGMHGPKEVHIIVF